MKTAMTIVIGVSGGVSGEKGILMRSRENFSYCIMAGNLGPTPSAAFF